MKRQLIFRIFVDILLHQYEFFYLRDSIICLLSFIVVNLHSVMSVKCNLFCVKFHIEILYLLDS
jgi:hypothetical protein